jgi:hypothetical protein
LLIISRAWFGGFLLAGFLSLAIDHLFGLIVKIYRKFVPVNIVGKACKINTLCGRTARARGSMWMTFFELIMQAQPKTMLKVLSRKKEK